MFIGRKQELIFFEEKYQSSSAELVVLYGRRRIGKTELLREFSKNKKCIFYSCRECSDKMQLQLFSEVVLKADIPASRYLQHFSSWDQAFDTLAEINSDEKTLVIIDEFPYMCKSNSSIPSILQNSWDSRLKNSSVMIVLCGSSMSFIEKELLAEKNPLYGRATGIYKMNELSFQESKQFFPEYSYEDQVAAYGILGGVPHYLKQFDPKLTISQNIKKMILIRGSILYSEVEFLLRQELRETSNYNIIIQAIAMGCTTLGDISSKTEIEKTKLTAYLKNLVELGVVRREFSVLDGMQEITKVSRGIYKLTNNYFKFWYRFVLPYYSEIEEGDIEGVFKFEIEPHLNEYLSFVFEDICIQYIRQLNQTGRLDFHASKIGHWWGKIKLLTDTGKYKTEETEIDICAYDHHKKNFIFGECKYTNTLCDTAIIEQLLSKVRGIGIHGEIDYYFFSKKGFTENAIKYSANKSNIHLISLDDMASNK